MDLNTDKSKSFEISVVITDGLDPFTVGKDNSYIDLNVTLSTLLINCHYRISACLKLNDGEKSYYYYRKDDFNHTHLDMNKSMEELNISEGVTIILDTTAKDTSHMDVDEPNEDEDELNEGEGEDADTDPIKIPTEIHIMVVSRLGVVQDGIVRKIKIITDPDAHVNDMVRDIENHFQRQNLKLKFGKNIVKADKSFREQGIVHGSEIVVTGRSKH